MKNLSNAYLDELRAAMDLAVQDLGEADKNFEAEVMMQAATALDGLRQRLAALERLTANGGILIVNSGPNGPSLADMLANSHFSV